MRLSELVGQSVDIFHKNPAHQRSMLADPSKFPIQAQVQLGSETFDLIVCATRDESGIYLGPMISWSLHHRETGPGSEDQGPDGVCESTGGGVPHRKPTCWCPWWMPPLRAT